MPIDLNALAAGGSLQPGFTSGSSVGNSTQTVVVTNQNDNGACLPCEESGCTILPTEATVIDNGAFIPSSNTKVRYRIQNTSATTAFHVTFLSNFRASDTNAMSAVYGTPGVMFPSAFDTALVLTNGVVHAYQVDVANGQTVWGGSIISEIMVQFTSGSAAENIEVKTFRLPVKVTNPPIIDTVYEPFCDACFTTNNGTTTTHRYRMQAPTTSRHGVDVTAPAGSDFILELCYAIINLPNTAGSSAARQMANC